jgi:hypothetical protein
MHCYKFPTRTQFRTLAEAEGLITEEGELITASHSHAIDEVGTITEGGEEDPETGKGITPATVISGWHVNYAGEPPEAWEEYLVTPQHPARVWA